MFDADQIQAPCVAMSLLISLSFTEANVMQDWVLMLHHE
jgi:hypothetical protein